MATGADLFALIKRLEKNEKRHFTQKTKFQKKESHYRKVFDLLLELEEYDQNEVLERLDDNTTKAQLLERERYLYSRIMLSLKEYHAKKYIIEINDLFLESAILYEKALYKIALKKLNKAEKLAKEYALSAKLLEILPFKGKVVMEIEKRELSNKIDQIYHEATQNLSNLNHETNCRYLNASFIALYRTEGARLTSESISIKYNNALKKGIAPASSFYAKYYYYSMQALYAKKNQKYEQASQHQEKVIQLWDKHPKIKKENLQQYITQLANYIVYLGYTGNYDKVLLQINIMEAMNASNNDAKGELFQNIYFYKQQVYLSTQAYHKAYALIPEIKAGLKKYKNKINPSRLLSLYYNTALTLWFAKDYELANKWLIKIQKTNARSSDIRSDIRQFASWVQLALFYELDSYEPLLNKIRAVNRHKKQPNAFQKTVLKYFKILTELEDNTKNIRTAFTNFLSELEHLPEKDKAVLGYREYCIWIKQKVNL